MTGLVVDPSAEVKEEDAEGSNVEEVVVEVSGELDP